MVARKSNDSVIEPARKRSFWSRWMSARQDAEPGPDAPAAVERQDIGSAKPATGRLGGVRTTRGGRGGRTLSKARQKRKTYSTVGVTRGGRTAKRAATGIKTMPKGGRRPKRRTKKTAMRNRTNRPTT